MASSLPDTRREILCDSAALNRLLAAVIRAHMLDEEERLENLLAQVTPAACDRVAALVMAEAHEPRESEQRQLAPVLTLCREESA